MFSGLERLQEEEEEEVVEEDDVVEDELVGVVFSSVATDTWNRPSLYPPAAGAAACSSSSENGTGCPPGGIPVKDDWCVTLLIGTVSGLSARLSWASRSSRGCWD